MPGITTLEDCADGCSSHPDCKSYVFGFGLKCFYKSTDDSSLLGSGDCDCGPISTCYYSKWVYTKPAGDPPAGDLPAATGPPGLW